MRAESERGTTRLASPWRQTAKTTLEIVAGGSFAAFGLAHAQLAPTDPEANLVAYWVSGMALVGLPLGLPLAMRSEVFGVQRVARWRLVTIGLGALALYALDGASGWHVGLAVMTFLIGSLLARQSTSRAEDDRGHQRAATWLLALAPAQVLFAMAAAPSGKWIVYLLLVIGAVCLGALVQSVCYANARLRARAPRRLVHDLDRRRAPRKERVARLRAALPLSAILLLGTALLYPAFASIPRPRLRPESATERAVREAREEREAREAEVASSEAEGTSRVFAESLVPGGSLSEQSQEVVMTVRPRLSSDALAPTVNLGMLYLRGACLDTFTETGMRAYPGARPALLRDGDDGREDGWVRLSTTKPERVVWYELQHQSFRTRGGSWEVLFAPQPPLGMRADSVYYDPNNLLALRSDANRGVLDYTLLGNERRLDFEQLEGLDAVHEDSRFLQLPRSTPELSWVERVAREETAGAENNRQRVQAVLDYFAREYEYSLRTRDVPGIVGITSFMRRRKGHCTSFAASAVLMLRSLGVSARVATGFLASKWSEEDQMYLVSTANGHAWIEVYFDEVGWCVFDPTPSRTREQALAAAELGEEGLAGWWSDLRGDLSAWAQSGADEGELSLLLDTLSNLPRAFIVSAKRHPLRAALALALFFGLIAWVVARRRKRVKQPASLASPAHSPESTLLEELLRALHKLGVDRRSGETLRELSARAAVDEADFELEFAVRSLYRARFAGSEGLQAEERARIKSWIAGALRRSA